MARQLTKAERILGDREHTRLTVHGVQFTLSLPEIYTLAKDLSRVLVSIAADREINPPLCTCGHSQEDHGVDAYPCSADSCRCSNYAPTTTRRAHQ